MRSPFPFKSLQNRTILLEFASETANKSNRLFSLVFGNSEAITYESTSSAYSNNSVDNVIEIEVDEEITLIAL